MGPKHDYWWTHGYIKAMSACERLRSASLSSDKASLEMVLDRLHSELLAATEDDADKVKARRDAFQGVTDGISDSDFLPDRV